MFVLAACLMAWVFLTGMLSTGLIGPNRTSIQAEFDLLTSQYGMGVAIVQTLACAVALVLAGWIRKIHAYRVLMAGLALQAAGFALIWLAPNLPMLMFAWAAITFATVLGAVANTISMTLWKDNPRRGVILLHAFNSGGKVLGPLLTAACLALKLGWRGSFAAAGGVALLILLVYAACYRTASAHIEPPSAEPRPVSDVLRMPRYWFVVFCFWMIAGGETAFATLLPQYLEEVSGYTKDAASLVLTVHLAGLMCGRFAAAMLGQGVSNNRIIALCLASGLGVLPVVFARDPWIVYPALFVLGFMFSATWPTFFAQVTPFLSEHREMLAYGALMGSYVGISMCIWFSSLIADTHLGGALLFGPGVLLLFGALYALSPFSRAPQPVPAVAD